MELPRPRAKSELLEEAGFSVDDDTVLDDDLGGGEWLFVRATFDGR
ncbi:hypothetical protein ACFQL4_05545 [Halosimplex aquaticum]